MPFAVRQQQQGWVGMHADRREPSGEQAPMFQVDAFAGRLFAGNPATVIVMERFPDDALMRDIAAENKLPETAFLVPDKDRYRLRWFTPTVEVPLCGRATLASSAVVMERLEPGKTEVVFDSASGPLTVRRASAGYVMDFRTAAAARGPASRPGRHSRRGPAREHIRTILCRSACRASDSSAAQSLSG